MVTHPIPAHICSSSSISHRTSRQSSDSASYWWRRIHAFFSLSTTTLSTSVCLVYFEERKTTLEELASQPATHTQRHFPNTHNLPFITNSTLLSLVCNHGTRQQEQWSQKLNGQRKFSIKQTYSISSTRFEGRTRSSSDIKYIPRTPVTVSQSPLPHIHESCFTFLRIKVDSIHKPRPLYAPDY